MSFRFSIRSLLLVTVVAGISAMFAHSWMDPPSKRIVKELNRARAQVYVMDHYNAEKFLESPVQVAHVELESGCTGLQIDGVDSYSTLLAASRIKAAQRLTLRQLAEDVYPYRCDFQHLLTLHIGGVTNRQVRAWVAAAPNLDHLSIASAADLTPETIASVAQFGPIKSLQFADTSISADHIAALSRLPALRFIGFNRCELEAGVFDRLQELPVLRSLQLYGSQYDNETLVELQKSRDRLFIQPVSSLRPTICFSRPVKS